MQNKTEGTEGVETVQLKKYVWWSPIMPSESVPDGDVKLTIIEAGDELVALKQVVAQLTAMADTLDPGRQELLQHLSSCSLESHIEHIIDRAWSVGPETVLLVDTEDRLKAAELDYLNFADEVSKSQEESDGRFQKAWTELNLGPVPSRDELKAWGATQPAPEQIAPPDSGLGQLLEMMFGPGDGPDAANDQLDQDLAADDAEMDDGSDDSESDDDEDDEDDVEDDDGDLPAVSNG